MCNIPFCVKLQLYKAIQYKIFTINKLYTTLFIPPVFVMTGVVIKPSLRHANDMFPVFILAEFNRELITPQQDLLVLFRVGGQF